MILNNNNNQGVFLELLVAAKNGKMCYEDELPFYEMVDRKRWDIRN